MRSFLKKGISTHARFRSLTRTHPIFPVGRPSQRQPAGGQSHAGRHERHRHHRPRQHVRRQRILQLRQQEEQRPARGNQGLEEAHRRAGKSFAEGRTNRSGAGGLSRQNRRGGKQAVQTHHRLRDVRGTPHHGQEGRQTRPKRLASHRPGQERKGLPQPHQAGVPRMDEGLLHASTHRPKRIGEIPRGPHRLLGLPGRRSAQENNRRTL